MSKKEKFLENKKGISTVRNQLIESYQSGVIEDKENLSNNRGVNYYNNQKK